jgi:hypothetical protein
MANTHQLGEPNISARLRFEPFTLRSVLGVAEAMLGRVGIAFVAGCVIGIGGLIVVLNRWFQFPRRVTGP